MLSFFRRQRASRQRIRQQARRRFFRPRGEMLESRRVLSTETWSGDDSNDNFWTSNDNWDGIGGAGAGDDLVFPSVASRLSNNNDFDTNTSFNSLTFNGNAYIITGNQIELTGGVVNNPSGGGNPPRFVPNILLGASQSFNSLTSHVELDGVVNLNGHDLTLTGAGDHRFDGQVSRGTGTGSGITKNGNGTARFFGDSPNAPTVSLNTGTMVIEAGAIYDDANMNVNGGSLIVLGAAGTSVLNGGTLRGTGTVSLISVLGSGGTIAPGNTGTSTGILTSTGNVNPQANLDTLEIDLNGTTVGTQYDRLTSTGGDINLNGANLSGSVGFATTAGQTFTIVTTSGAGNTISGQFAQGTSVVIGGILFTITYSSTSVVLTTVGRVFSISDPAPILEGNSGTQQITFTISRTSSVGSASVQYATSDGSATASNNDYVVIPPTTLNFANGQLSQNITVTINGDLTPEFNESIAVNIFNASAGYLISATDAQGISAMSNDDFDWVIDGTGSPNTINLVRSGSNLIATGVPGGPITVPASPSNGALDSITVNGLGGADTLILDYSGGNFGGAEITYAGGDPSTGLGDSLRTLGGSFASGVSTPTSGSAGSIVYTGGTTGASTINYTGLEPIDDLNTVTNYTINATNGLNFINIVNGPDVSGTQTTQVNDGAVLFERINFANKANVTVNALDGSDQIVINNSLKGVGLASLIVNGSNGDDQFSIHGPGIVSGTTYTFNGNADNDLFSVSGGLLQGAITVNGDVHTGQTPPIQDRLTVNSFAANVTQTASQLQFSGGSTITFGTLERVILDNLNTLSVSGTSAVDTVALSKPSPTTFRSILNSGIEVNFDKPLATVGAHYFANPADGDGHADR